LHSAEAGEAVNAGATAVITRVRAMAATMVFISPSPLGLSIASGNDVVLHTSRIACCTECVNHAAPDECRFLAIVSINYGFV
jgi:hypothetical protein